MAKNSTIPPPAKRAGKRPGSGISPSASREPFPAMAELILSAMESGSHSAAVNRRALRRWPYRVKGQLCLFSDLVSGEPRVLYTRDVHARGLGFITQQPPALGHGGFIEFPGPDGRPRRIQCTVQRCRETAPGWYDGAVCFNREQPELSNA
jgi:hypothetical protein